MRPFATRHWLEAGRARRLDPWQAETRDLEVVVEGQCLVNPSLAHRGEAHGIGEREVLVSVSREPIVHRSLLELRVAADDEIWRLRRGLDERERGGDADAPHDQRVCFSDHQVGGHDPATTLDEPADDAGEAVVLGVRCQQERIPGARVDENFSGHVVWARGVSVSGLVRPTTSRLRSRRARDRGRVQRRRHR